MIPLENIVLKARSAFAGILTAAMLNFPGCSQQMIEIDRSKGNIDSSFVDSDHEIGSKPKEDITPSVESSGEPVEESDITLKSGAKAYGCKDNDEANHLIKGKVISDQYPEGIDDYCSVAEEGTYLMEGTCAEGKYKGVQFNCSSLGSNYKCAEGACIQICVLSVKTKCETDATGLVKANKYNLNEDCSEVLIGGEWCESGECKGGACVPNKIKYCTSPETATDDCIVYIPDKSLKAELLTALGKNSGEITFGEAKTLTYLSVGSKGIWDIEGMQFFRYIEKLHLNNNNITSIGQVEGLVPLKDFRAAENPIKDLRPLKGLVNLEDLSLCGNPLIKYNNIHKESGECFFEETYLYFVEDVPPFLKKCIE
jgi:hypothetical protein